MDTNTELRVQETAVSLENCESIGMPIDSYQSYFLQLEFLRNDILLDLNYRTLNFMGKSFVFWVDKKIWGHKFS